MRRSAAPSAFAQNGTPIGDPAPWLPRDVNGGEVINILDIQAAISQALGFAAETAEADVTGTGSVKILDVQNLINTVLGAGGLVQTVTAEVPPLTTKIDGAPAQRVIIEARAPRVKCPEHGTATHDEAQALKGTRHMWLYGFENLPEKWDERLQTLKDSQMKTARAWRLKETLRAMYQCANVAQAQTLFSQWHRDAMRSKLAPVKKVARMLKKHLLRGKDLGLFCAV